MTDGKMNRRTFLAAAAVGAGAVITRPLHGLAQAATAAAGGGAINAAILGAGTQGMVLLRDALAIPGVRFKAVCDIWAYSQKYASGTIRKAGQDAPAVFEDYREMLAGAGKMDLQAVIIATPDWMHAEQAVAAMKAGLHVYCEKEMSQSLAGAGQMVQTARQTGRLCQIGHQRRSNPLYRFALDLIARDKICGRVTTCYGQWNRPVSPASTWPEKFVIPDETLKKYGYADADGKPSMHEFRNWRWYRKYSAGPIADLGSHQIDIFNWFLGAEPAAVLASGGRDFNPSRQWCQDILAVYEYNTKGGSARAFYQVLNSNGYGNYFERFMGEAGTISISEDPARCHLAFEPAGKVPEWMTDVATVAADGQTPFSLVEAFKKRGGPDAEAQLKKNIHRLHLENFFAAVRAGDVKLLTCPPETAYATAAAVLAVNDAVESGAKVQFKPEQFKA
ncbi:MAG: Gfo/Idh/MocA family oxidoreductase [Planctomycetota bacterium]|nr:Gfo/Idh/MocA family oxidoreductase [Planctomycetota bacterium]